MQRCGHRLWHYPRNYAFRVNLIADQHKYRPILHVEISRNKLTGMARPPGVRDSIRGKTETLGDPATSMGNMVPWIGFLERYTIKNEGKHAVERDQHARCNKI